MAPAVETLVFDLDGCAEGAPPGSGSAALSPRGRPPAPPDSSRPLPAPRSPRLPPPPGAPRLPRSFA